MQPRFPPDHHVDRRRSARDDSSRPGSAMPAPSAAADALATVRGRLLLLTGGRRGTPEDALAVGAALLLDAALDGAIAVEGRKRLGLDRRRVVRGSPSSGGHYAPLVATVSRRVEAGIRDTPWGWCERLAVFAEDAVGGELAEAGLVRAAPISWRQHLGRRRTLEPVNRTLADEVRAGLVAVASRRPATPADIALAAALHGCDVIEGTLRGQDVRRLEAALGDATRTLPGAVRSVAEALRDRRRRVDSIGTWYADD